MEEKINQEVLEEGADSIVQTEETSHESNEPLKEIIIGIPANTAMMKVSVLTVNENGVAEEKSGEFNFEQLLKSRAKVLQLIAAAEGVSNGTNGSEHTEPDAESGSSEEKEGEAETDPGRETGGEAEDTTEQA